MDAPRFDAQTGEPIVYHGDSSLPYDPELDADSILRDVAPLKKTPVLVSSTKEQVAAVERIEAFEIDGVSYTIAKKPNVGLALRFLKVARRQGEMVAAQYLLEEALGTEAFDALTNCDTLESGDIEKVMDLIKAHTMGGLDSPK